jgi:hypothetical protein
MTARIQIFNRLGIPLTDLQCDATLSWEANKAGKAIISIARTDAKVTADNLLFRNLVLIEDSEAGAWGGVIWQPQTWYADRVEVTAYSGEFLFKFRRSGAVTFNDSTGDIFAALVDMANAPENLEIVKDEIWAGSVGVQLTVKYDNLYDTVVRFANRVGNDFALIPRQDDNNNLRFLAQWYQFAGTFQNFALEYPFDFKLAGAALMTLQSDIVNDALVFGSSAATSAITPTSSPALDDTSRGLYGLIQGAWANNSVVAATLDAQAAAYLNQYKYPRRTFVIQVINNTTKNTFSFINIGDILQLRLAGIGFAPSGGLGTETYIRIKAKEFNTRDRVMTLTVDEVIL